MYKSDFDKYLNSKEYRLIEYDPIYQELRKILVANLGDNIFLDIEELLHAEILFKLEQGFKNGYSCKNNN